MWRKNDSAGALLVASARHILPGALQSLTVPSFLAGELFFLASDCRNLTLASNLPLSSDYHRMFLNLKAARSPKTQLPSHSGTCRSCKQRVCFL